MKRLLCRLGLHDWRFVPRTWLQGSVRAITGVCHRCGKLRLERKHNRFEVA